MSSPPRTLIAFHGRTECRRDPAGPLGLTLVGRTDDRPEETVHLAFAGRAPEGLPDALDGVAVEEMDRERWRIAAAQGSWTVAASAVHLHYDVSAAFHRALPPVRAPLSKRLFWRAVLALAGNALGRRLLLALRRSGR